MKKEFKKAWHDVRLFLRRSKAKPWKRASNWKGIKASRMLDIAQDLIILKGQK